MIDLRRSIRGNRITSQAKREAFVALAAQTLVHAGRNARLSVSVCQTLVLMDEMNLRDRLGELFPLDGGHPA